jgi:hypothetical protein
MGQQGLQIGVLGQDHGQGAVTLQLAAQDGGVQGGGGGRLTQGLGPRLAPRDLAGDHGGDDRDDQPEDGEDPPLALCGIEKTGHGRTNAGFRTYVETACAENRSNHAFCICEIVSKRREVNAVDDSGLSLARPDRGSR